MEFIESIQGVPRDISWEAAIVIQGPYHEGLTMDIIRTFLSRNTNILVIVSTYTSHALTPFEKYMMDEGVLVYITIHEPPASYQDFWRTNRWNQNLQRLSSYIGLAYAQSLGIEFSLKIRSDMYLEKEDVVRYLKDKIEGIPVVPREVPSWAGMNPPDEMKGRIAISGHATFNVSKNQPYPYHIRDFWLFGHTTDLMRYFDITERSGWRWGAGMLTLLAPESNLAIRWMNDMNIIASDTMELVARYFVIINPEDVDSQRMNSKVITYAEYMEERKKGPVLQWVMESDPDRIITEAEWATQVLKLL